MRLYAFLRNTQVWYNARREFGPLEPVPTGVTAAGVAAMQKDLILTFSVFQSTKVVTNYDTHVSPVNLDYVENSFHSRISDFIML